MPRPAMQLTGQIFSRLTVINRVPVSPRGAYWLCQCSCGKQTVVSSSHLVSGHTRSCGCFAKESQRLSKKTHGHAAKNNASRTYACWANMWTRCTRPQSNRYQYYGGRGIRVCPRWGKFENFLADMGEKPPGLTLDRIDVNGDYKPSNCRWATTKEQALNRQTSAKNVKTTNG